ncbi:MAG: nucleoside triphosphate pyrophosphatase [Pseudomonadota bacterium]
MKSEDSERSDIPLATQNSPSPAIVLGSSSSGRRMLLARVVDGFAIDVPAIDESPLPGESPSALAARLANEKALAVAARQTDAIVIGGDQVAACGQGLLEKPETESRNIQQLYDLSHKSVDFYTSATIIDTRTGRELSYTDHTQVRFRALETGEVKRYVERDQPMACAGGFKIEGAGIGLFDYVKTEDPTALVGLPMIFVCRALRSFGVTP